VLEVVVDGVVVVLCIVVEVVVDDGLVVEVLVGVVLDVVEVGAQPAFRITTLQLARSLPAFTARFDTCAAQLT